jgi:HAD superfamily hydrolase (TIGR01509 family)
MSRSSRGVQDLPARGSETRSALVFDLDGTLVDTVYAHVLAWQGAFEGAGFPVDAWRIHRRIGMSHGLFTKAVGREIGRPISPGQGEALAKHHGELFRSLMPRRRPLPGAVSLLRRLREARVPFGIATSGRRPDIDASLEALELPDDVVVIGRDDVVRAKPAPDLFLACQTRLGVEPGDCYVIGDSVWDLLAARRAGMHGVGLLTGGYGQEELLGAGASLVFRDAAELDAALEELGVLP